jgi:hypothetical protein
MMWKARWIFTVCSGCRILEQNRNNAKGRTGPIVIILRNQWLAQEARGFAEIHRRTVTRKDLPRAGVCLLRRLKARQRRHRVARTIIPKSIFAAAALAAAAISFDVPAGHAAGWRHEPWCAVLEYDDVTWDCSYRTFEECYPNVIGGIRGSCNPNPDGPGTSAAAPAATPKPKKHRAQQ